MAQMTPEVSRLLDEALSLSREEREALATCLISDLSGKVDADVQAAWDLEIKRRVDDIRSGKAKMIPYDEVRRRLMARLQNATK